jgi:hypothetical protein
MDYNNGKDVLRQLHLLKSHGGNITKSSSDVTLLPNGLSYFFVEVTLQDGTQYGIPAYGEEARELHREAKNWLQ